jgi:putative aldouronate transport system substrate-binding protein
MIKVELIIDMEGFLMKRYCKLFICLTLILSFIILIVGCASKVTTTGSAVTTQATTTETTQATTTEQQKPIEIKMLLYANGAEIVEGTKPQKALEEKFNVKIIPVAIDIFDKEKIQLLISGGDTPDVMSDCNNLWMELYNGGLIRDIPVEMVKTEMPVYYQNLTDTTPKQVDFYSIDSKLYALPAIVAYAFSGTFITELRQDWMDNVGITEAPKTIADFEEILKRFTFNDPDKNGKDDTYGLSGLFWGNPKYNWTYIYGAFGTQWGIWQEVDGKPVYSNVSEAWKNVLKQLNAWYKMGVLDPEFVTTDEANYDLKFANSKFGVYDAPVAYTNAAVYTTKGPGMLMANKPDAKLLPISDFTGPDGKRGSMPNMDKAAIGANAVIISKSVDDAKLQKILQILEYTASTKENFLFFRWGTAGETYDMVNGLPILKKDVKAGPNGLFYYAPVFYYKAYNDLFIGAYDGMVYDTVCSKNTRISSDYYDLNHVSKAQELSNAEMDTIVTEFFFNAITGKVDIDAEWDTYVQNWNKAGGEKVTAEIAKTVLIK